MAYLRELDARYEDYCFASLGAFFQALTRNAHLMFLLVNRTKDTILSNCQELKNCLVLHKIMLVLDI